MNIKLLLILAVFFSTILRGNDSVKHIPLPFDETIKPFIHNNLIVAYLEGTSLPLLWDPSKLEYPSQWSRIINTNWDIFFDKAREEMVFCKPDGRKHFLSVRREENHGSVNLEASILSNDHFFAYYWDGVVKAWDISGHHVNELWSSQLEKAKYGFADLSLSLDKRQLIILRKQAERSERQFGVCAVLDSSTGKINFDSNDEVGNTNFVFPIEAPVNILLNSRYADIQLINLRLSTGEPQTITLSPRPAPFYASFQGPSGSLLILDKVRPALHFYKNNFAENENDKKYLYQRTISSSFPDEIMDAGVSLNGSGKIYLLFGDGQEIHTLKFINHMGEDEFSIRRHIPQGLQNNRELSARLSDLGGMVPHFSYDQNFVLWGNRIANIKEKKVLHSFDNVVLGGEFFKSGNRQFFLSTEWLSHSAVTIYKLYEIPAIKISPSSNEFFYSLFL